MEALDELLDPEDANFILTPAGDLIEAHRVDDPAVWGLADVARGRTPCVPTTIYKVAGDSVSGVVGLLYPDGTFRSAARSNVGREFTLTQDGETFTVMVGWDGAARQHEFRSEEGELRRESSRGILLGDYWIRKEDSFRRQGVQDFRRGKKPDLRMAA